MSKHSTNALVIEAFSYFCRIVVDAFVFLFPYKSNNVHHLTLWARIFSHPFAVRGAVLLTCTLNTIASRRLLPFVVGSHLLSIVITSFKKNTTRQNPGGYSLIWVIRVRAAGQGIVFWPRCPKQSMQFDKPLS